MVAASYRYGNLHVEETQRELLFLKIKVDGVAAILLELFQSEGMCGTFIIRWAAV
jgi:hypothetical protein